MKRTGFSVFVKYRKRRLTLKRGLPSLEAATRFAEELKKTRFHTRDDIIIVDERSGEAVTLGAVPNAKPAVPSLGAEAKLKMLTQALEQTERAFRKLARVRRELRCTADLLNGMEGRSTPANATVLADAPEEVAEPSEGPGLRKSGRFGYEDEARANDQGQLLLRVAETVSAR